MCGIALVSCPPGGVILAVIQIVGYSPYELYISVDFGKQISGDDHKVLLQDIRLEQKYGIIRGCRRKSSMAVSHRGDS